MKTPYMYLKIAQHLEKSLFGESLKNKRKHKERIQKSLIYFRVSKKDIDYILKDLRKYHLFK